MWSIALLCSFAAGHPHHGLKHSGGKKVVAAETPEIECPTQQPTNPGYIHYQNTCPCDDNYNRAPGDPAPSPLHGTCNTDDCDCVEFHRAAGLTYAGQG